MVWVSRNSKSAIPGHSNIKSRGEEVESAKETKKPENEVETEKMCVLEARSREEI